MMTSAGLLALLGSQLAGARVLYPRAAEPRAELGVGLRAAGADVVDVVAYRTVAAPPDQPGLAAGLATLSAGLVDLLIAYAPSQLVALDAALVGAESGYGLAATLARRRLLLVCVGPTTAAAAHAAGITSSLRVADEPSPEAVAAAVRAVYAARHELP